MSSRSDSFTQDNAWQRRVRDRLLLPFYGARAESGRYVLMDKGRLATLLQRRLAVDTVIQTPNGGVVSIEEKIVRWPQSGIPYTAFCLETKSCTVPGRETDGWMVYGQSDYLLYAFANRQETVLRCYLVDFPALKDWFWSCDTQFPQFNMSNTLNHTAGRVVPISCVTGAVRTYMFSLGQQNGGTHVPTTEGGA